MDTEDINTAQKIWVWNVNGLGYSSTGINGTFGTAITMDGQIVADFVNTGILNAQLVKSGILESLNGKSWINMETGDFNLGDKVSYENGVFQISVSSSDVSTSDGSSLNDKLDSIDNAINDITDSPTVEISGEQVFIEKEGIITPSSITLNAIVENTTDAGKWQYYDNINWVDLGETNKTLNVIPTTGLLATSNATRIRYIVGTIYDEMTIVKLIDGKNGQTTYLHIKYSDDGGKTFTANNGETLGSWIGTYTDFTEADSSDVSYYLWKKFVGENGKDGTSVSIKGSYTQAEWNNTWQSLVPNATNGDGYLVDGSLYVFDGVTFTNCGSIKGETGEAGKSSYLHIKYSNDGGKTFTNNDGETVGDWMGTYVDNESSDSTNVSRYTWKKIVGEDGIDGKDGANAQMVIITGEQAFKYTNNFTGIPTPETIVLTANKINTTANGTWQYMDENGVWQNYIQEGVIQTGSTINISYNSKIFGTTDAKTMRLRYFISDIVSDEITLIKLSDGANGLDAYTIILTNENDTFNADQNGNITSAITTTTNVIAYKGSTPVTPTIGTLPTVNGLTLSKSGTTITIQANTGTSLATNGKIDIPITVDGKSFTKVFSWSKVNKGTNAYSASIGASSQVFKSMDGGQTFAPDTITLTPILQNLSYSKWQYSTDGGSTWTDVSSGSHGLTLTDSDVVTITYGDIVLSKTSSSITKGSTDTFTVKLNQQPTNNQTVSLSVNNSNASINKTSLTFTPSNYSTAQSVTITGSTVGTSIITLSSPNVSNKTISVTITDSSSGGSSGGGSGTSIETASQGFNTDGSLDGKTEFTHTETYIPFDGNIDKIIQFGKTGWIRVIFYNSSKTKIGYFDSTSAVTSLSMSELKSKSTSAVYVRVSINQTTTITLTGTSATSVSTLSLDDESDLNSISAYSNDDTIAKNLIINESSDLFTTSTTSIVFKLVTNNSSYYDVITIVKLSDGENAYSVVLTNESQSIPTDSSRIPLNSDTYSTDIIVYQGITQRTDFTIGTINSANGITVDKLSNSKVNFTVSTATALSADNGTFTIPITIDGKTFNKVFSWSCSKQGMTGVGISSVAEYYAISSSNTTAPTSWSTTVPTMTTTNKYLWNYETITYTNNATKDTEKRVIGVYGDKGATGSTGATGNGISTITNYYLATSSSSGITTSTSGWTTSVQSVSSSKKYLWNYEIVTYTNGSTDTTIPCIIGAYGDTGTAGSDAYTIILTNENHTFPCDYDGNIASAITTTTQVLAFKGTKQITPTIGTLPTVTGLSLSKNSENSTITIVANSGSSLADNGTFTIPVVVDGITFNKTFSWSKSKAGLVGSNGEDGYTVLLTNENYTFIADSTGNIETTQTTTTNILVYKGATSVECTIGTLPTVSGLTLSSSGNVVTIQANTGTNLALNGTFDIIISADGKSFIKTFSWSKSLKGLDGADGADGLDGAGAKAIDIIASSQVFKSTDGGETYTPDTIKLSPVLQNINFSKWQYSINGGSTWLDVVSGEHGFVLSGSGDVIESYGNIVVSQTSLSFKSGETQTFNVNLSSAPTKNQVVTINASGCSIDKTSLTFTPSNYKSTQTVTVGGSTVGNGTIVLSSPNVNNKTVNVTIMQGTTTTVYGNIVTSANSLSFTSGSSTTLSVKLDKAPTNSQVVNISSSGCNVNTSSLTFTSTNYNTYQKITVSGTSIGTGSITLSSLNVSAKTITVTINSSSGGSSGGSGGGSGTSIVTDSQGFNSDGTLDGNTAYTHTETYIPFSGNTDATIQFGTTGWTRYVFYDNNKNMINTSTSSSAITSITMAELQTLSPNAIYVRISINQTTTITLTGGSGAGGDSGESTLTIKTANKGFNEDGSLDGNTAFTHTETYIPFSGNTDKIIQFGTTGWTRYVFYDSSKNVIGSLTSSSAISSVTMTELQSLSSNAIYVRVSINQTTTIALVNSTSVTTMSLNDIDAQPISVENDSGKDSNYAIIVGTELTISKFSDLFTDTVTSIVFKALTTDSNLYDTITVVKLRDASDIDVEEMINSAVNPLIEANEFLTTRMDNAFSDGVITSYEKINMKTDLKEIDAQYEDITKIVNLYNNSSINGIYNEYKTAYDNLHNILDPVLSNMNSDSTQSVSVAKDAFLQYGIYYSHLRTALDTYIDSNFTDIQTTITTMSNNVDIAVTKSTSNEQQINTMSKHMSFSDNGWLELYADNNGKEGRFKTQITDTKMAFLDNNSEVAYMSNQKLYINQAEVVNEMKIGNIVITISDLGGLIFSWDD